MDVPRQGCVPGASHVTCVIHSSPVPMFCLQVGASGAGPDRSPSLT